MIEVIMSTYRDGSLRPEVYFAAFFDEEERLARHLVDERYRTSCGKVVWGRISTSGLASPNTIDCEKCRQLLEGARFELVPARHLEAVAS